MHPTLTSIPAKKAPKRDFVKKCLNGDVEAVKSALKAGADVNCRTSNQDSYLIAVLKENNPKLEMVEILINAGADVNYQEPTFGTTALMHVRNLNMAKILIQAGADPSILDFNGHLAYQQYHFYLYEELEDLRKYLNACYEKHLLMQASKPVVINDSPTGNHLSSKRQRL